MQVLRHSLKPVPGFRSDEAGWLAGWLGSYEDLNDFRRHYVPQSQKLGFPVFLMSLFCCKLIAFHACRVYIAVLSVLLDDVIY